MQSAEPTIRIEDYALIGDCQTAALVSRGGSIDWLCCPRFDSDACFAALLGTAENGRWLIAPSEPVERVERRYRENTLILETTFFTAGGVATVTDFMPPRGDAPDLVRIVTCRRGRVALRSELVIRFGYGAVIPWVSREGDLLRAVAGPDMIVVRSDIPLHGENMKTVGDFVLEAGQHASFVLAYGDSHKAAPQLVEPFEALEHTEALWHAWIARSSYDGEWPEAVRRSLITLKALTYEPTGGLVAAPTTSLPEWLGGTRNWDYRFCWLRDATLTLLALMDAGFSDEARAWRAWLLRAVAGAASQLQIMYGIAGERRLPEWEVPWLDGFARSKPVRIGNAAAGQRQLDVFGELMDALYQARHVGLVESPEGWALQKELLAFLERVWREPDEGIWEVRGGPQHFTHSKVMAWVAFDRAIRSAEEFGLAAPLEQWRAVRSEIHREVCERGFSRDRNSFVQAYGSELLDASLLLLPIVGFLPAHDPRMRSTVAAVEQELTANGLVLRYNSSETHDGLPPGEGAFIACSFWLADNYVLQGRHEEARALFERLLALRNDVGLMAEEYDAAAQRQLGNFPQAFSHLALVSTALNLATGAKPVKQRQVPS